MTLFLSQLRSIISINRMSGSYELLLQILVNLTQLILRSDLSNPAVNKFAKGPLIPYKMLLGLYSNYLRKVQGSNMSQTI